MWYTYLMTDEAISKAPTKIAGLDMSVYTEEIEEETLYAQVRQHIDPDTQKPSAYIDEINARSLEDWEAMVKAYPEHPPVLAECRTVTIHGAWSVMKDQPFKKAEELVLDN
jgi:hypothetical protein